MTNNTYVPRILSTRLKNSLKPGRVAVIYGPRRVGKTTLIRKFLEDYDGIYKLYNGEDIETKKLFTVQSIEKYQSLLADSQLLVIDEAQKIENIGLNLKIIVDHLPNLNIIASGSSSFDLAKNIGEPLTGRKWTYILFPIAQMEFKEIEDYIQTKSRLEERLIYGAYPEVVTAAGYDQKKAILTELVNSYLYKDLLELEGLHYGQKISDLLTLLAFQIGKEVSLSELGNHLEISKDTVRRYLNLLEQAFVLINIRGFSRNLRKEVSKTSRYYFYDNGVRNTLINNFNPLARRDDIGMLWENYVVIERLKKQAYTSSFVNNYFWRTYEQREIDWVEEKEGKLFGYEIRWRPDETKPPKDWLQTYPNASYNVINRENYLEFIT